MAERTIASGGPWITEKEIAYVSDAVANGWYGNWSGYLTRFEKAFADWLGVRHAIATSSCTGAIHLAMCGLGIGEGDEVIVPEVTWIASVTGACYTGATPVFVDVEPDTWCIDPEAVRRAITPRTKAIVPVHMYGHPADMSAINAIAEQHGIFVLEDAAPGIGSRVNGELAGTLSGAATFSFQGAKPLVTGEGGMFVTDDEKLYEKVYWYWDHCRDPKKVLFNTGIGFKYKMSNIQAALGLAQLERADEIIEKRRQIFFWYRERLSDIEGLSLNVERPGVYNNYYVPTVVLDQDFARSPEQVMAYLDERGVRNRPFFRAISKFPMFKPAETPVADRLAARGINLPCASMLREDEVDYSCKVLRDALGVG